MITDLYRTACVVTAAGGLFSAAALPGAPFARADNHRLNNSVVSNVYTIQQHAGCTNDVKINPKLRLAAQWHTDDVMANRSLTAEIGPDGSSPPSRANAA